MDVKDGGAIAEALLDGAFTKSLRVVFTTNVRFTRPPPSPRQLEEAAGLRGASCGAKQVGGWELVDDIKSALKTKMAFLGPDSSLHTWMEVRRVVRPRRRLAKKTVARLTSMGRMGAEHGHHALPEGQRARSDVVLERRLGGTCGVDVQCDRIPLAIEMND